MVRAAPALDPRLVAAIVRIDDRERPIAETHRRVGQVADRLGIVRPSYEQVRILVHAFRAHGPSASAVGDVLLDIAFRVAPPQKLLDVLAGVEPPRRK
jgi:hypothetical protein